MDEVQRRVRRGLLDARRQLEALESAASNAGLDPAASADIHASFRSNLGALERDAQGLRAALSREPPARRETQRARLADLDEQLAELRAADARLAARFGAIAAEVSVREELFQRRGAANGVGSARGDAVIGIGAPDAAVAAAYEHKSLMASTNGVSGIMATGAGALDALVSQRVRLKGARRKVMDVMNTVGVGRKLIAQIERRDRRDTILMYSLMGGILVLLALAVLYKHHRKGSI